MSIRTVAAAGMMLALAACSDARQATPETAPAAQPVAEDAAAIDADCGCKRQPIKRLANPITPKSE